MRFLTGDEVATFRHLWETSNNQPRTPSRHPGGFFHAPRTTQCCLVLTESRGDQQIPRMNEKEHRARQFAEIQRIAASSPEAAKLLSEYRLDDPSAPQELAALEVEIERMMCKRHFYHFVRKAWIHVADQLTFEDNWHLGALCYHYQALWERQFDTLIVNISPGCSKSTIVSVLFPVWIWINEPSAGLWHGSFSKSLCIRDSDRTRQLIQTRWFKFMFGDVVGLRDDSGQLLHFSNKAGGWRLSSTLGSKALFGTHPRLISIDDPHDPRGAASVADTEAVLKFWTDQVSTRGILTGVVRCVTAQRLSEMDLSAHVKRLDEDATHLWVPMLFEPDRRCVTKIRYTDLDDVDEKGNPKVKTEWADPRTKEGEMMWPGFYTVKRQKQAQKSMRAHQIAGQFQQNPTSPEGDMFVREWFESIVDKPPTDGRAVRCWDKASTVSRKADYTAGVLMVFDGQYYYIVDVVRGKWARKERDAKIRQVSEADADLYPSYEIRFEREGASAGKDAADMQAEELASDFRIYIDKALGKPKKLLDPMKGWDVWSDMLSRGIVKMVRAHWNDAFIREHMAAPLALHDDMVDAAAHCARVLFGTGRRRKIRRPLLLISDEDKEELMEDSDSEMCQYCYGIGCPSCNHTGTMPNLGDIASIIPPVPEDDVWLM